MGAPRAIQEDVRWPAEQAQLLGVACAGLVVLLAGQHPERQRGAGRAQDDFRGNKSKQFARRLSTNRRNADGLVEHLRAMQAALVAAERWAVAEQAARVRARQEEDDRRFWGLMGVVNDVKDLVG